MSGKKNNINSGNTNKVYQTTNTNIRITDIKNTNLQAGTHLQFNENILNSTIKLGTGLYWSENSRINLNLF